MGVQFPLSDEGYTYLITADLDGDDVIASEILITASPNKSKWSKEEVDAGFKRVQPGSPAFVAISELAEEELEGFRAVLEAQQSVAAARATRTMRTGLYQAIHNTLGLDGAPVDYLAYLAPPPQNPAAVMAADEMGGDAMGLASRVSYARQVRQLTRNFYKKNSKRAAKNWDDLKKEWSQLKDHEGNWKEKGLQSPKEVLLDLWKENPPLVGVILGKTGLTKDKLKSSMKDGGSFNVAQSEDLEFDELMADMDAELAEIEAGGSDDEDGVGEDDGLGSEIEDVLNEDDSDLLGATKMRRTRVKLKSADDDEAKKGWPNRRAYIEKILSMGDQVKTASGQASLAALWAKVKRRSGLPDPSAVKGGAKVSLDMVKPTKGSKAYDFDAFLDDVDADLQSLEAGGSGEDDFGEDDLGEDDFGEDDLGEDDFGEDDLGEDDFGEDDLGEDDFGEDDLGEDDFGEDDLGEDDFGEDDLGADDDDDDREGDEDEDDDDSDLIGPEGKPDVDHAEVKVDEESGDQMGLAAGLPFSRRRRYMKRSRRYLVLRKKASKTDNDKRRARLLKRAARRFRQMQRLWSKMGDRARGGLARPKAVKRQADRLYPKPADDTDFVPQGWSQVQDAAMDSNWADRANAGTGVYDYARVRAQLRALSNPQLQAVAVGQGYPPPVRRLAREVLAERATGGYATQQYTPGRPYPATVTLPRPGYIAPAMRPMVRPLVPGRPAAQALAPQRGQSYIRRPVGTPLLPGRQPQAARPVPGLSPTQRPLVPGRLAAMRMGEDDFGAEVMIPAGYELQPTFSTVVSANPITSFLTAAALVAVGVAVSGPVKDALMGASQSAQDAALERLGLMRRS